MPTRLEILYAQTQLSELREELRDWAKKEQNNDMRYCWRAAERLLDDRISVLYQKLDEI